MLLLGSRLGLMITSLGWPMFVSRFGRTASGPVPQSFYLALCLCFVLGSACSGGDSPTALEDVAPAEEANTVSPSKLSPVSGAPVDVLLFEGAVESSLFTELRFAVAGRVELVRVREGDLVRKGAVLVSLDRIDRNEQLEETRRRLGEARVAAGRGSGGAARTGQIPDYLRAEIQRRLRAAEDDQADLAATKRALGRAGRLEGREGMNRVLATRAYRAGRKAQSRSREVDERTADERLAVALMAALEQREKRLERELEECDLVSPFAGVVVMVRVGEGQAVQTRGGDAAVVLIDPADLIVRTAVPEALAEILGPGEDAWLEFEQPAVAGTASVLAVDTVSYAVPGMAGGFARDVLLTAEPGLLSGLRIGAVGRVALRR